MSEVLYLDFKFDDQETQAAMGRLVAGMKSDFFREQVGAEVQKFSQARVLAGGPAPDGQPWEKLKPSTLRHKKRPDILNESGSMMDSIIWQLQGEDEVAIGSAMVYARIHQMGGKAGPNLRVTIPARPYLGLSGENRTMLNPKVRGWLQALLEG